MNISQAKLIFFLFGAVVNQGCASRSYPTSLPEDSALSISAAPGAVQKPLELASLDGPKPLGSESESSHAQHNHAPIDHAQHTSAESNQSSSHAHQHGGPDADSTKTVYQCPMHSQVVSDTPGDCPICGMTLEKKESK